MKYKLVQINIAHYSDIINIWRKCFSQDEIYLTNFTNLCLPHATTFGMMESSTGSIVSCATIIPSSFLSEREVVGAYLYGVATLEEHRGNSLSKIIIEHILKNYNQFDYILVKPATDSLFKLYRNQGFPFTLSRNDCAFSLKNDIIQKLKNSPYYRKCSALSDTIDYPKVLLLINRKYSILNDIFIEYTNNLNIPHYPISIFKYSILDSLYNGYLLDITYIDGKLSYFLGKFNKNTIHIADTNYNFYEKNSLNTLLSRVSFLNSSTIYIITKEINSETRNNDLFDIEKNITTVEDGLIRIEASDISLASKLKSTYINLPME